MGKTGQKDRIIGAIMGGFIGDALGLGCHWYYDLKALKADCGEWISDYIDPRPDRKDQWASVAKFRYEAGLKAGDLSQTGQVTLLLLESIADNRTYDHEAFTEKLDALLKTLDGTAYSGRYTDWAMRDVWAQRHAGMDWSEAGSSADTSEAAFRSVILAARFYQDPVQLAEKGALNIRLTHRSPYIVGQTLSFTLTLAELISGSPLPELRNRMRLLSEEETIKKIIPSFDCLAQVGNAAVAVKTPVAVEPASLICSIHGLNCTLGFMLPAAYYLIHRYPDDFEMAVLSAVNGGGNNMSRAALTGALSGAMNGLKGIPERLITGLSDQEHCLELASRIAEQGS